MSTSQKIFNLSAENVSIKKGVRLTSKTGLRTSDLIIIFVHFTTLPNVLIFDSVSFLIAEYFMRTQITILRLSHRSI